MMQLKTKIEFLLKNNKLILRIYQFIFGNCLRFLGLFIKIDNNLILFNSIGKSYTDSPRVIHKFLLSNNLNKKFKYIWAIGSDTNINIPDSKVIKMDSIQYFYYALKAKYWISSVNIERGLNFKKKDTIYLNTWHGVPLKLIGNAVSKRNDYDFSNVNILCCSGSYEKEIFIRDFNANEDSIYTLGLPRNDELCNNAFDIKQKRKELDLLDNKKIILYAPTWRENVGKKIDNSITTPINVDFWRKQLGEEYVVLVKAHSFTKSFEGIKYDDFIIDVSSDNDVNGLMMISDILITDYSSIMFDYSLLEKPIICFGYDYKLYSQKRGFYFKLEDVLPSGVLKHETEVIDYIKNIDYEVERKKVKDFRGKYLENDINNNSTQKYIELLIN